MDSDEETAAVMSALAQWNPQPVLPQPIFEPIRRTYQRERLRDQLNTATNGGRVNIFKVVGLGVQKLPETHPDAMDLDAPGEPDVSTTTTTTTTTTTMHGARRSSSFSTQAASQAASQRPSVNGRSA